MYCGIFDQTGDQFFSASQDGIVRVFDYTGRYFKLKREIVCHEYGWSIVSLVQSPDQRNLAFCSLYATLNIVDLGDDSSQTKLVPLASIIGANDVFCLSYCGASSTRILCARNRGRVTLCDVGIGECEELDVSQRRGADVNAVTTLDDSGNIFVAGGDDTCIRMFDTRALNEGCLACFPGHADGITYIDSKNDGRYFLSNSKDQTVRLWDIRTHSKAGSERRTHPREPWDYRIHRVPRSYRKRPPNDHQAKSVLTLSGHTVRYTLIRAKFSPLHSTGQQFAYAGSASGDWHIWDLTTGQKVSENFAKVITLRDVSWHPWEPRVVTSGLNGSITCWCQRRKGEAQRKPLFLTPHHHGAPPTESNDQESNDEASESADEEDEQARFLRSTVAKTEDLSNLSRAGFYYRFPRRRSVPSNSYIEVVSDLSNTESLNSIDEEGDYDEDDDWAESDSIEGTGLRDLMNATNEEYLSEDDPDFRLPRGFYAVLGEDEDLDGVNDWEWSSAPTSSTTGESDGGVAERRTTRSQTRRAALQNARQRGRRRRQLQNRDL
ncbi:unnamed protein product [Mesocestoides corti]|nr:unnamed protein product [Mesocestoides corti]